MARYKIYDNKSDVITPVGEKLTAEQWLDRYQWVRMLPPLTITKDEIEQGLSVLETVLTQWEG